MSGDCDAALSKACVVLSGTPASSDRRFARPSDQDARGAELFGREHSRAVMGSLHKGQSA